MLNRWLFVLFRFGMMYVCLFRCELSDVMNSFMFGCVFWNICMFLGVVISVMNMMFVVGMLWCLSMLIVCMVE